MAISLGDLMQRSMASAKASRTSAASSDVSFSSAGGKEVSDAMEQEVALRELMENAAGVKATNQRLEAILQQAFRAPQAGIVKQGDYTFDLGGLLK